MISRSAACQPFEYDGFLWGWTIDTWVQSSPNLTRSNNTWVLTKYDLLTGAELWQSEPVTLEEFDGYRGAVDFQFEPEELIQRHELDTESHTKVPHLLHPDGYSLLGCTHQGVLVCYDLSPIDEGDPGYPGDPVEIWRKDNRLRGEDDLMEFLLPICMFEGKFVCAFRKVPWTEVTVTTYIWPTGWDPDDAGSTPPTEILTFEEFDGLADCGIVLFDPATGSESWRWEVPETGVLREWTREGSGQYEVLSVDVPVEAFSVGTPDEFRRPSLALIDRPPKYIGDKLYWRGSLVVTGPANYYQYDPFPFRDKVGEGPGTLYWNNITAAAQGMLDPDWPFDDSYGEYGPYGSFGNHIQFDPEVSPAVETIELRKDGTATSPEWEATWYSVYRQELPASASGGKSPHSLTRACASPHGVILGPRPSVVAGGFTSHPAVWRCVDQVPIASTLEVVSDSNEDAGKVLHLTGFNVQGDPIEEDLVLAGTTPVRSIHQYLGQTDWTLSAPAAGTISIIADITFSGANVEIGPLNAGEQIGDSPEPGDSEAVIVWTQQIAVTAEGWGWACSAPLCLGEKIYTVLWETQIDGSGSGRNKPFMAVLSSVDGEILSLDEIPDESPTNFDYLTEAPKVGFELVFDGSAIYVPISNKLLKYGG